MPPTLEQLLRVPHVDPGYGFDISPDGKSLAFSWNLDGSWEIYEISLSSSAAESQHSAHAARRLSTGPGGKFHPRYSPDGRWLAFALDLHGSESYHIAVCDRSSGQTTDLTPDIPYAHQPNINWSPDGRQLAVLSDAREHFALYTLPIDGSDVRLLLDVGHPGWDAHWSRDGEWIAVESEWHGQDRSIYLLNTKDGASRQLQQNGTTLNAMHPAWSPDGRKLAFCADPNGWYRVGLYDVAREEIKWLETIRGEETNPAWSPDGNRLACINTLGADTSLRVHHLSSRTETVHRLGAGIHSNPHFSNDGQRLLFIFESPRQPDDVWQLDIASGEFTQLTHSLPDDLDTSSLSIPDEVWYPSADGTMVPAMLYKPSAPNSRALINIHGGPNWLYQCNWHPLMSYLAAQGWAVLAPNYRGSTGYGRAWALANYMRLGEVDTSDCAAGAKYLLKQKLADPAKILVSGRSHGGYLTMTCLTEYPDLWAAGSAVVPFMNWFTCHENSRPDLQHWGIENFGDPVANADLWRRRSPFFYLQQVQAGVQLICGANDPRCPASESIAARDRLQELGRQVELVLYPDEGHVFLKLENVIDHELKRLAFLENAVG